MLNVEFAQNSKAIAESSEVGGGVLVKERKNQKNVPFV